IVNRSLLSAQVPKSIDIAGLVSVSGDVSKVRPAIEEVATSFGVKSVLAPDDFVSSRSELLRGFERVIQWMLLFTLLQALVGVVNTLLLSVGERRREFGLLRAAGATRKQILRVVMIEGGAFAIVGTLLGLIVGTLGAFAAMQAIRSFGVSGFVVPIPMLVLTALAASGLGVVAAIVPARWAAAVPPLEAVVDSGGSSVRLSFSEAYQAFARGVENLSLPTLSPAGVAVGGSGVAAAGGAASVETERVQRSPLDHPDIPPPYRPWIKPDLADSAGQTAASSPGRDQSGPGYPGSDRPDSSRVGPDAERPGVLFSPGARERRRVTKDIDDVVIPERLSEIAGRLDPASLVDSGPLLEMLADQLANGESVANMVQGWVKSLPCLVARTDKRVIVLVSKFPEPLVQSLELSKAGLSIFGPPGLATVSMAVIDNRRLLEVIGIRDRAEAMAMAKKADSTGPKRRGYF
ncbi:MAG: FtsX-like permease family protein, partial [Microthrixaceae bacterium]|nr:FtsX-like permease family protein [Microthrixaceae bacterium]